MALNIFFPAVSGLNAQSQAMNTISTNIANLTTIGYKKSDTLFQTMLGSTPTVAANNAGLSSSRVDIGGVRAYDRTNVTAQGVVSNTGRNYDVAINGTGNAFFVVKSPQGDEYYTRAGSFNTQNVNGVPHLVTPNGCFLQGWPANDDGTFSSALQDVKIDYPNSIPSVPTSNMEITANVPADGVDTTAFNMTVYGPNHDGKAMNMIFTKVQGKVNAWEVSFDIADGTTSTPPIEVQFTQDGKLLTPKSLNLSIDWNDGSSNPSIDIDISTMTQYTGSTGIVNQFQDGRPSGSFMEGYIDNDGIVKAKYSNGVTKDYAKIALASFTAPENLTSISGTMFEYNTSAGDKTFYVNYDSEANSVFASQAVENSTANIEEEFAKMITVQRAYGLNGKSFTTADEMTQTAVNLKS